VLEIVNSIWLSKTETASRVRGRIEAIIDYATPQYRIGDNPASWKILKSKLPRREKISKVEHHAALPYADAPAFMTDLRARPSISAHALEFLILTVGRSGEVLGAAWSEINFDTAVWTVPAERMKAEKEHVVPLSGRALDILRDLHERRESDFVFPGMRVGKALSDAAMSKMLDMMNQSGITVHGFRSTFRDWAGDRTAFDRETIEFCLAHNINDATEAAYRRSTAIEKRRKVMEAWADYCGSKPASDTGKPLLRAVS
jgi:integrase